MIFLIFELEDYFLQSDDLCATLDVIFSRSTKCSRPLDRRDVTLIGRTLFNFFHAAPSAINHLGHRPTSSYVLYSKKYMQSYVFKPPHCSGPLLQEGIYQ